MNPATDVALAAVIVTLIVAGSTALWKLATMLAEVRTLVRGELKHNGGGSTKDYAREAAVDAAAARAGIDMIDRRVERIERVVFPREHV